MLRTDHQQVTLKLFVNFLLYTIVHICHIFRVQLINYNSIWELDLLAIKQGKNFNKQMEKMHEIQDKLLSCYITFLLEWVYHVLQYSCTVVKNNIKIKIYTELKSEIYKIKTYKKARQIRKHTSKKFPFRATVLL